MESLGNIFDSRFDTIFLNIKRENFKNEEIFNRLLKFQCRDRNVFNINFFNINYKDNDFFVIKYDDLGFDLRPFLEKEYLDTNLQKHNQTLNLKRKIFL